MICYVVSFTPRLHYATRALTLLIDCLLLSHSFNFVSYQIQATHLDTHRHSNDVSRPTEQRNVLSAIEEEKSLPPHRVHSEPSVYTHRGPTEGVRNSPLNKLPMGHLQHSQTAPQREQGMVHPSRVVKQVSYAPAFKVAKGVVPDNSHGYPVRYTRKGRMTGQDEDKERTKSPLDTPAPRKHAPIPHSRSPRSKPSKCLTLIILHLFYY